MASSVGDRRFERWIKNEVKVFPGGAVLRRRVLRLLQEMDASRTTFSTASETVFITRTSGHHRRAGRALFQPLHGLFNEIFGEEYRFRFAIVGYGKSGRGSLHHDRAVSCRLVLGLSGDGNFRSIKFSLGRESDEINFTFAVPESSCYAATSLARNTDQIPAGEGGVRHQAIVQPWDVALVVDLTAKGLSDLQILNDLPELLQVWEGQQSEEEAGGTRAGGSFLHDLRVAAENEVARRQVRKLVTNIFRRVVDGRADQVRDHASYVGQRCGGTGDEEAKEVRIGRWTEEEHQLYVDGLAKFGKDWSKISTEVGTRTPTQVRERARYVGQREAKEVRIGPWTEEEHQLYVDGLAKFGKDWSKISTEVGTRTPTQVRDHASYVGQRCGGTGDEEAKEVRIGPWTEEEHQLYVDGVAKFGKDWNLVATEVGTRTPTQVRKYAITVGIPLDADAPPAPKRPSQRFGGPKKRPRHEEVED